MFKKVFMAGFVFAVSILVAEIFLRVIGLNYTASPLAPDPVLHHTHQKNIRFINYYRKNEFTPHPMFFDAEGRVKNPHQPLTWNSDASTRVILMGDSFVEGAQVPFDASFFGILAYRRPSDATLINAGVPSYSPVPELLQWRHELSPLKPTHVVLMLFMNDIVNDLEYASIGGATLPTLPAAVPGPKQKWYTPIWHGSYLCRLARRFQEGIFFTEQRMFHGPSGENHRESQDLTPLTEAALISLISEIRASGSALLLTAVPSKQRHFDPAGNWNEPEFADKIKQWAGRNQVDYLDLATAFRQAGINDPLFFKNDIHFTAAGHALVAAELMNILPGWTTIATDPVP